VGDGGTNRFSADPELGGQKLWGRNVQLRRKLTFEWRNVSDELFRGPKGRGPGAKDLAGYARGSGLKGRPPWQTGNFLWAKNAEFTRGGVAKGCGACDPAAPKYSKGIVGNQGAE